MDNEFLETMEETEDVQDSEETKTEEVEPIEPIEDVNIPIYGKNGEILENIRYGDLTAILEKSKKFDQAIPLINNGSLLQNSQLAQDILAYQSERIPGTNKRKYTDAEIIKGLEEFQRQSEVKTEFDSIEEENDYKRKKEIEPLVNKINALEGYISNYVGTAKDKEEVDELIKFNNSLLNNAFDYLKVDKETRSNLTKAELDAVLKTHYPHMENVSQNPEIRKIQYMTPSVANNIIKILIENKMNKSKIKNATKGGQAPEVSGNTSAKPSEKPEQKHDKSRGVPPDILDQELRKFNI